MTIRTVIAAAVASALTSAPAVAAPVTVVDPACKAQRIKECATQSGVNMDSYLTTHQQKVAIVNTCSAWAEYPCYTTVDIPNRGEINAMMAENNRLQREQWAAWLKVLEETGVVKPPVQPLAPPPTR